MNVWVDGRILAGDQARIPVQDRSLEHGLGLFETMRVNQDGRVPLLDRHLSRIASSALALGLPIEAARWPTPSEIVELATANGFMGEAVVRLTLSAGSPAGPGSTWMTARPVPAPLGLEAEVRVEGRFLLDPDDELHRHKTLNHWRRRRLTEKCRQDGVYERIGRTPDGRLWEAIWANVFIVSKGRLITPPLNGPMLPGIMRALVLERAKALGIPTSETDVTALDGEEVFLTNAVRGIAPVTHCDGRALPASKPITAALREEVRTWLALENAGQ